MPDPTLDNIPTPALVIDLAIAQRNIRRLAAYAKKHKLALRPHTKTHKSILMAGKQLAAGASGLTIAKVGEAQVMAQAGDDLMLAYPALDPARTTRIAELAHTKAMRVAVDSALAIDALAAAARAAGSTIGILPDLDAGMHRTGVQSPRQALTLAQRVSKTKGVRLDGLFCYPGHIREPADRQKPKLAAVADLLAETLDLWAKHGLEAMIVSGGSTPTAYQSHLVPPYTEIRPGTYIYNDAHVAAGGWCAWSDCAASVVVTVVSTAVPGKCVVDAGSKTLTSDRQYPGPDENTFGRVVEYPKARLVRLTEEHGEVSLSMYPRKSRRPRLGQRLTVIMNHVCPCVNLHRSAWLKHPDGSLEPLPIDARGLVS